MQSDRDPAQRGFSTARFADQAQHFALVQREADMIDRMRDLLMHGCT